LPDVYYNFYTFYEIEGYKNRVLAFVDLDKRPDYLSYKWCLSAHLTLFPSLPYRMWMSSITGKVDTTVHKMVWTTRSHEQAEAGAGEILKKVANVINNLAGDEETANGETWNEETETQDEETTI